jgi:hypothetical protein
MIPWAASADFTPLALIPGTVYYYVIVTNTNDNATDIKTAEATSEPAAITVTAADN